MDTRRTPRDWKRGPTAAPGGPSPDAGNSTSLSTNRIASTPRRPAAASLPHATAAPPQPRPSGRPNRPKISLRNQAKLPEVVRGMVRHQHLHFLAVHGPVHGVPPGPGPARGLLKGGLEPSAGRPEVLPSCHAHRRRRGHAPGRPLGRGGQQPPQKGATDPPRDERHHRRNRNPSRIDIDETRAVFRHGRGIHRAPLPRGFRLQSSQSPKQLGYVWTSLRSR